MRKMNPLACFSVVVVVLLLSQSVPISSAYGLHEGLVPSNPHSRFHGGEHGVHKGRDLSANEKDPSGSLSSSRKHLRVYVRKRRGGGGLSGVRPVGTTRSTSSSSSSPNYYSVQLGLFLCLSLSLGHVLLL